MKRSPATWMGEDFEKKKDELFGEEGFEKVVDKVAAIEKSFGIYDLAQLTLKGQRVNPEPTGSGTFLSFEAFP